MGCEESSAVEFEVRSYMPASSKNPLEHHWIHARTVRGILRLKYNKRWHRIDGEFETSAEKARQMRLREDPSIAHARIPDTRVLSASRNGEAATSPNLQLATAIFGTILGECSRDSYKHCQKKKACLENGFRHKSGHTRKRAIREESRRRRPSYSPSPPSTVSIWPVMNCGAVAKNITAAATSAAVPLRCMGVSAAIFFMNALADFSPSSIIPGATALTAICGARALAITPVNMCSAALDEQ